MVGRRSRNSPEGLFTQRSEVVTLLDISSGGRCEMPYRPRHGAVVLIEAGSDEIKRNDFVESLQSPLCGPYNLGDSGSPVLSDSSWPETCASVWLRWCIASPEQFRPFLDRLELGRGDAW
jgi:hypothetical protein